MKKLFISASAAALLIFSGCAKDETGPITGNLEPVEFSTTINNRDHATRVDNDSNWENDHIGIFMIAENAAGSVEGAHASNKKHTTSSTGTFASAAGHEIFFPESGEAVHFVAYHPYAEGVTNMIALDVEDQSSQSALDLMYAITDVAYTTGVVELTFGHEMSKLIFNIKDLDPAATMIGATATLKGFNTEASFDLSDAHLSVTGGTVNDIEGFVRSETKTQTTFEFIVFPYDVTSPVLEIALADGMTVEYKFGGASEVTFAKNRKYTYNLNLKGDGTPEEVGGGADIDPWDDAPEVNDDIEKPGTGKDAHFSFDFSDGEVPSNFTTTGSNIQLAVAGLTRAAGDGGYLHITGTAAANGDGFTIELPKPIDAKNITLTLKGFMTSSALFITFNDDHSKGFPYAGTVSASYNHGAPGAIDYNKATYALMGFTAPNWCKTVMPLDKDNSSYPEITYIGEVSTIHFTTGEGGVFDLYIDEIFSEGTPETPEPVADYTKLFINEVKASADASGDDADFVELYNAGDVELSLAGLKLHDSGGAGKAYPLSGTIAAGGFVTFTEETHLPWGIGAKGDEYIVLLNADGTEHSRVNIPALSDVTAPAYARTEDGDSEWAVVANPTKNASNAGGSGNGGDEPEPDPIADYTKLFINEVKTSGDASGDNQDFIELFNAGNAALDLTGFKLHDSGNKNHLIISGSIEAGGFMTFTETTHFSWGLSAKGDEYVVLLNPNGTQHSRIDLPAMADITKPAYARTEDGGSTWATVATPTKNASNNQ